MKPDELKKLIRQPEGDELGFKAGLPPPRDIAVLVFAFPNTKGGRVVIGVEEGGRVGGVRDINHARLRLTHALTKISQSINIETETIQIQGKSEECTPEQIGECHRDVKEHPCVRAK